MTYREGEEKIVVFCSSDFSRELSEVAAKAAPTAYWNRSNFLIEGIPIVASTIRLESSASSRDPGQINGLIRFFMIDQHTCADDQHQQLQSQTLCRRIDPKYFDARKIQHACTDDTGLL